MPFAIDYASDVIDDVQTYDPRSDDKSYELPLKYSNDELDQFCLYISTHNAESITRSALTNMKTMFDMLDKRPYRTNDSAKARLEYIKLGLEARVDKNLTARSLVKQYILQNCDVKLKDLIEGEVIKSLGSQKMANDTCKYMNTMVFDNLVNGWSIASEKRLNKIYQKKNNGYYSKLSDFAQDMSEIISDIEADIKRSEEYKRDGKGFDLSTENAKVEIENVMSELAAPSNKLKTGIQYLNKMLNGGFESGRVYGFMGITGVGKSIILLSCALWIMRYNKLPVIDGKKQAILFISQENSKSETLERIFNISISGEDIRGYSTDQIYDRFNQCGLLTSNNDTNTINFIFRYYSDKEIGVTDIDGIISDLDKKDIQVIAVVQDYIEKLKPKFQYTEMRHSLGSVATELAELAKARQIPVITAAQLNRTASSVVSDAVANKKTNTTKLLGKANISESWDMMKNLDACIIINRETDDTLPGSPQYMGFKLEKFRGKPNKDGIFMFLHPFDENNPILLIPDMDGKPLSKMSIEEFNPLVRKDKPVFEKDDNNVNNDYLNFCSTISDEEDDDEDAYIDICKHADDAVKQRLAALEKNQSNEPQRSLADDIERSKEEPKVKAMCVVNGCLTITRINKNNQGKEI